LHRSRGEVPPSTAPGPGRRVSDEPSPPLPGLLPPWAPPYQGQAIAPFSVRWQPKFSVPLGDCLRHGRSRELDWMGGSCRLDGCREAQRTSPLIAHPASLRTQACQLWRWCPSCRTTGARQLVSGCRRLGRIPVRSHRALGGSRAALGASVGLAPIPGGRGAGS